jgi:FkbM family methyltransferase
MKIPKSFWFDRYKQSPRTICEVGTGGRTDVFQCEDFINLNESKFILVEANTKSYSIVESNFSNKSNFSLHNVAVCDYSGEIKYYNKNHNEENASGFIDGVLSPAVVNDAYRPKEEDAIIVKAVKFSEIDDGNIDILFCDVEGAEWYILKHMISRPKIISLETHGNQFVNQNIQQIEKFMSDNGYLLFGRCTSDSLYIKI